MAEKQQDRPMPKFGNVLDPDLDWVAKVKEPALEPDLPIVDPHHHLWDRPNNRYLLPDLLADCNEGHNVIGTVFVECGSMFRASGPEEMKAVGEVEFVTSTIFDVGVYLVVIGLVLDVLRSLGAEVDRQTQAQRERVTA